MNQDRTPRGPKRGHLKALRSRIGLWPEFTFYTPKYLIAVPATLESLVNRDLVSLDINVQHTSKSEVGQFPIPPESSVDSMKRECRSLSHSVDKPPPNMSFAPTTAPEIEISDIIEADLCA